VTVINAGRRIPIYTKGRKDRIGDDLHWQKATPEQPRRNVDQAAVAKRRKANKLARKQRKRKR
jgi:hypothetical protein